jgi:hypothetical protein
MAPAALQDLEVQARIEALRSDLGDLGSCGLSVYGERVSIDFGNNSPISASPPEHRLDRAAAVPASGRVKQGYSVALPLDRLQIASDPKPIPPSHPVQPPEPTISLGPHSPEAPKPPETWRLGPMKGQKSPRSSVEHLHV